MCWCRLRQRIHKLEYLCDYIIVYLSHLFLPKALRESIMFLWWLNAINDSFIGVRVATVKFSLTWQMSTFCGLLWTYTIKLCSTSSWLVLETETTAYVTFALQAIFGNEIADLSVDELKNNQYEKMDFAADRDKWQGLGGGVQIIFPSL